MLRSMFSAVSGLRSHQTMMDVTGNNVSNVNTAGYKASRTTFQETLSQLVRGGTAGDGAGQGGVNPMQIGLGAQVSATDLVFTQGATQVTGRATDVAIQGEGFFIVDVGGENLFMRAGAFSTDSNGALVGPGGQTVQGWIVDLGANPNGLDPQDAIDNAGDEAELDALVLDLGQFSDIAIGADGKITGRNAAGEIRLLGQLGTVRFGNPGGLENLGNGLFAESPNAGDRMVGIPGVDGRGSLQAGTLEMSNVDLAQEFTNLILAQRGYQANARTITASDELLQELVNLKR